MSRPGIPKPRSRVSLTTEKELAILKDVQFISTVMQLVLNRWHANLFDAHLSGQALKGFSRQIYNAAEGMRREIGMKFNSKDKDEFEFELATSMDRVVSFFCLLPAPLIDSIMDSLEAEKRRIEEQATSG